jgi:hypothetical protein
VSESDEALARHTVPGSVGRAVVLLPEHFIARRDVLPAASAIAAQCSSCRFQ